MRLTVGATCAGLVAATLAPASASGQAEGGWSVVSARMTADLTADDGTAEVTLLYVLSGTPRGATLPLDRPIPVELLGFGSAAVQQVAVGSDDPVVLWPTRGRHRAAEIEPWPAAVAAGLVPPGATLPPSSVAPPAADVLPLEITYRVEGAVGRDGAELRGRLPVLTGPSAPEAGAGGGFEARLLLPEAWRLSEGFPSTLRTEEPGVWSVALPVTPAFVGFRARADGSWRPGPTHLVDLVTLTLLVAFTLLGWRHLRSVAG